MEEKKNMGARESSPTDRYADRAWDEIGLGPAPDFEDPEGWMSENIHYWRGARPAPTRPRASLRVRQVAARLQFLWERQTARLHGRSRLDGQTMGSEDHDYGRDQNHDRDRHHHHSLDPDHSAGQDGDHNGIGDRDDYGHGHGYGGRDREGDGYDDSYRDSNFEGELPASARRAPSWRDAAYAESVGAPAKRAYLTTRAAEFFALLARREKASQRPAEADRIHEERWQALVDQVFGSEEQDVGKGEAAKSKTAEMAEMVEASEAGERAALDTGGVDREASASTRPSVPDVTKASDTLDAPNAFNAFNAFNVPNAFDVPKSFDAPAAGDFDRLKPMTFGPVPARPATHPAAGPVGVDSALPTAAPDAVPLSSGRTPSVDTGAPRIAAISHDGAAFAGVFSWPKHSPCPFGCGSREWCLHANDEELEPEPLDGDRQDQATLKKHADRFEPDPFGAERIFDENEPTDVVRAARSRGMGGHGGRPAF